MSGDDTVERALVSMKGVLPEVASGRSTADLIVRQANLESLVATEHTGCLMCGSTNTLGLKLKFEVQPDGSVLATFPCREVFRSYAKTLHGGVISALLDAAMTNALFSAGVVAVTVELTVRFLAPVATGSCVAVRASIVKDSRPLFYVRSELEQGGRLMARASAKFLVKNHL